MNILLNLLAPNGFLPYTYITGAKEIIETLTKSKQELTQT